MGSGIAQLFLQSGARVVVSEVDEPRSSATRDTIVDGLDRWARKQQIDDAVVGAARAALDVRPGPAAGPFTLVVESVPEDLALKQSVLEDLSRRHRGVVLGTNTSALSIDLLAGSVAEPDRFVGIHFFNPVPRSLLVELVVGDATSTHTVQEARREVDLLGLTAIEVRDSPGFATSRLGIALGMEAIRMVEEGVASAADIDRGMVLGYRLPIGPLELSDLVGLDVRLSIADHLHRELGPRFEPPALLREMVRRGRLGRKTGQGFYEWDGTVRGAPAPVAAPIGTADLPAAVTTSHGTEERT